MHSLASRTALSSVLVVGVSSALVAQKPRDFAPYLMDRATEIALARTAAPRHVSDSATILVLGRSGFVEAAKGTNGFTCAVMRSFSGNIGDPEFWNPRTRAPHCFNPAASRSILVEMTKRAEWILAGTDPNDIKARTDRAYASHELPMPGAGAMAYMLSPQQHLLDADPHWKPHVMFYYDRSQPASAWGAAGMTAPIIDATGGSDSPVITLLIPVSQWSDGRPAVKR